MYIYIYTHTHIYIYIYIYSPFLSETPSADSPFINEAAVVEVVPEKVEVVAEVKLKTEGEEEEVFFFRE